MRFGVNLLYRLIIYKKRLSVKKMFERYFSHIINVNKMDSMPNADVIECWVKKWSIFGDAPATKSFRAYARFMNGNINTVPNEIARNYIEPILTPEEFQPFYNDKNSLGLILPTEYLPRTLFRSVNGILYDGEYNPINKKDFNKLFDRVERIIVKPSKDMGGHGVSLFIKRDDECFYDNANNKFSLDFLLGKYDRNFLVQECLKQSAYMRQFNPTSVNTLRVATYRDIDTGEVHILGAVLRIGGKGAFIDNACSGGSFVSVDDEGCLGKYVCTQYGQTSQIYNDINFASSTFIIPEFDKIKEFAKSVAKRLPHMSLFANDIAIDEDGNPRLIEINTTDFSYWFYQFNGRAVFGEYTDSVIEYAKREQSRLKATMIQRYM